MVSSRVLQLRDYLTNRIQETDRALLRGEAQPSAQQQVATRRVLPSSMERPSSMLLDNGTDSSVWEAVRGVGSATAVIPEGRQLVSSHEPQKLSRRLSLKGETLVCRDCRDIFVYTPEQLEDFRTLGFINQPLMCPSCVTKADAAEADTSKGARSSSCKRCGWCNLEGHAESECCLKQDATCSKCGVVGTPVLGGGEGGRGITWRAGCDCAVRGHGLSADEEYAWRQEAGPRTWGELVDDSIAFPVDSGEPLWVCHPRSLGCPHAARQALTLCTSWWGESHLCDSHHATSTYFALLIMGHPPRAFRQWMCSGASRSSTRSIGTDRLAPRKEPPRTGRRRKPPKALTKLPRRSLGAGGRRRHAARKAGSYVAQSAQGQQRSDCGTKAGRNGPAPRRTSWRRACRRRGGHATSRRTCGCRTCECRAYATRPACSHPTLRQRSCSTGGDLCRRWRRRWPRRLCRARQVPRHASTPPRSQRGPPRYRARRL